MLTEKQINMLKELYELEIRQTFPPFECNTFETFKKHFISIKEGKNEEYGAEEPLEDEEFEDWIGELIETYRETMK